eukprot:364383-Chlamydomonas_euryale.AAC.4
MEGKVGRRGGHSLCLARSHHRPSAGQQGHIRAMSVTHTGMACESGASMRACMAWHVRATPPCVHARHGV